MLVDCFLTVAFVSFIISRCLVSYTVEEPLLWDTSILGTPPGDTKLILAPEKRPHNLLSLLGGPLYSGERDTFSGSQNLGLTFIQETP